LPSPENAVCLGGEGAQAAVGPFIDVLVASGVAVAAPNSCGYARRAGCLGQAGQ